MGGSTPTSGRLEVLKDGTWASVAAWDPTSRMNIAAVACKELGIQGAPVLEDPATFGTSGSTAWLNVSACGGAEGMVQDCQCAFPNTSSSGTADRLFDRCLSGYSTLLPFNTSGMEAAQVAITCPSSGGARLVHKLARGACTCASELACIDPCKLDMTPLCCAVVSCADLANRRFCSSCGGDGTAFTCMLGDGVGCMVRQHISNCQLSAVHCNFAQQSRTYAGALAAHDWLVRRTEQRCVQPNPYSTCRQTARL